MNGNTNRRHRRVPNSRQESCVSTKSVRTSLRLILNKQRSKLTPEFYTKCNPRKGFTPVLSDWIKGLVLNFGVNLLCYLLSHCHNLEVGFRSEDPRPACCHDMGNHQITGALNKAHTHNHIMALSILSGRTRVSRYQKKHSIF